VGATETADPELELDTDWVTPAALDGPPPVTVSTIIV
jgi:hypothetical protein